MIAAASVVMLLASGPLARFIHNNPSVVMLALGFLLMIGMVLIADGFGIHVPKGYVYAAMAFSAFVEILQPRLAQAKRKDDAPDENALTSSQGRPEPVPAESRSGVAPIVVTMPAMLGEAVEVSIGQAASSCVGQRRGESNESVSAPCRHGDACPRTWRGASALAQDSPPLQLPADGRCRRTCSRSAQRPPARQMSEDQDVHQRSIQVD